jgi:hypothetical protein
MYISPLNPTFNTCETHTQNYKWVKLWIWNGIPITLKLIEEFYLYDSPFYAGHGTGLRCRCDSCDLIAVRFVYRYVV